MGMKGSPKQFCWMRPLASHTFPLFQFPSPMETQLANLPFRSAAPTLPAPYTVTEADRPSSQLENYR